MPMRCVPRSPPPTSPAGSSSTSPLPHIEVVERLHSRDTTLTAADKDETGSPPTLLLHLEVLQWRSKAAAGAISDHKTSCIWTKPPPRNLTRLSCAPLPRHGRHATQDLAPTARHRAGCIGLRLRKFPNRQHASPDLPSPASRCGRELVGCRRGGSHSTIH